MIKLIRVPGWELKNYKNYEDDVDVVVLWAEFSKEKMGLDFDILNVIPPRNKNLWGIYAYRELHDGSRKFLSKFLNNEIRENLHDIVKYYWDGDRFASFLSMRGVMGEFGGEFDSIEAVFMERCLLSLAIPKNSIDVFVDYFGLLGFYFGKDSLVSLEGAGDADFAYLDSLKKILAGERGEGDDLSHYFNRDLSDFEKLYISSDVYGVKVDAAAPAEGKFLLEMLEWLVDNYSLSYIEWIKVFINGPHWGGVERSSLRNKLRLILDEKLSRYPVIQTNPYEGYL